MKWMRVRVNHVYVYLDEVEHVYDGSGGEHGVGAAGVGVGRSGSAVPIGAKPWVVQQQQPTATAAAVASTASTRLHASAQPAAASPRRRGGRAGPEPQQQQQ
ncbi:Os02g0167900 [Oryza sativa Japonica Group]|uniref:Uncharacterized protein n=4 Tax=Oryza TaxID=4527 RepID=Q6H6E0_ORYSJ|nr:hypothetical protein OsI_06003 [Oryza sativa Indica Group]BAD25709.1 hypothetical protein [Oryza sativa Japonica Group]BAD26247.1 hypothetical protein [Oryza sativa Japonica Group]BAS77168.1 Os02g0167900 [Oryza sativa Japonica Group]